MKSIRFFLLICVAVAINILNVFPGYGQQTGSSQRLYLSMPDAEQSVNQFAKNQHIETVQVFYENSLDPFHKLKLDERVFSAAIRKNIPDSLSGGYGVIDWEGEIGSRLMLKPSVTEEYKNALAEFTKAIILAKKMRPNVKWGFFSIPYPPLDKRDTRKVNEVVPLLKLSDVLFPSLYVSYTTNLSAGDLTPKYQKDEVIASHLANSLNWGRQLKKPVLVFMWHRYYSAGFRQNSLQLIPLNEFESYVKAVLSYSVQGAKVNGVILWGNDTYYYKAKYDALNNEFSKSGYGNFKDYHEHIVTAYLQKLLKSFN
jgi:hypothetical protein